MIESARKLQHVIESYIIYKNLTESEYLEYIESKESYRICHNLTESARICQNLFESIRICQNLTESYRNCKNLTESARI